MSNKSEARKRIEKLKKVIRHHRYLYHVLDKQEISEDALDSLKHELWILEQKNPEFVTSDSPTQRVAGQPLKQFSKARHFAPMLSIEDAFTRQEVKDWQSYIQRLLLRKKEDSSLDFFCESKIDGLAVSLIYEDGVFERGATRGNGFIGEDVTQNLKTIESIPLRLSIQGSFPSKTIATRAENFIKKGCIEIRGEAYLSKKEFALINKKRAEEGKELYSSPRNLAAGSIRQLDSQVTQKRNLSFLAYKIVTDLGQEKHSQEHQVMRSLGFKADQGKICHHLDEIIDFWRMIEEEREKLPYHIDGIVININSNRIFGKLGVAGKSHRGARALKFPPEQAVTKVKDIQLQIGRTGAVTPVAFLESVRIKGAIISRATLHNMDEIKRLDVRAGDTVIVERAGDVIPQVVKVLKELRDGKQVSFKIPQKCPVCKTKLIRRETEVVWRCPNVHCPGRQKNFFRHFASKQGFDIEELGPQTIEQLLSHNLVSTPDDLFKLTKKDLLSLERFGEKSACNLLGSIKRSKEISLASFLFALGIPQVGIETASDLAQHFKNIKNLRKVSLEKLKNLPNIGEIGAKSIVEWFKSPFHQKLIDNLLKQKVKILISSFKPSSSKLSGIHFVLTGTLSSYSREDAKERIRLAGGKVAKSISSKIDYLVKGKNPGETKLNKARECSVKVVDEKRFLKLLSSSS
jgi:DNA ligase (NAD+)